MIRRARYIGTLPLHCALPKAAKPDASKNGAQYFIRVCLGKPVSGTTIRVVRGQVVRGGKLSV
jgi:hypothetical protein